MRLSVLSLLSVLLLAGACGTTDPPARPSIAGTWVGQAASQGTTFTFEMELVEANAVVSGTGSLTSAQAQASYSVEGSYGHPFLSLQLVFPDRPPIMLSGQVADDRSRIEATLMSSGFGGESIVLSKR